VQKKFPGLKLSLREGYPAHLEELLLRDEIDLAVTLIEKKPLVGVQSMTLLELPMVLLVEKNSKVKSAEELWARDKIEDPLICLPPGELLCKNFQDKLRELGVDWFPSIEASSADLIEAYVANGLGIGVGVAIPKKAMSARVRAVPLPGFPPVVIGALWRGKSTPLLQAFFDEMKQRAKQLV